MRHTNPKQIEARTRRRWTPSWRTGAVLITGSPASSWG